MALFAYQDRRVMKNPIDVLKAKEQELLKVRREIEALRVALPLLDEDDSASSVGTFPGSKSLQRAVPLP
jgi:hypothetical protein